MALNFDEFLRRDVVAVVRGVGAGVAGADDLADVIAFGVGFAEKHAAALVRVGLFAVGAEGFVVGVVDVQHGLVLLLPETVAHVLLC